MSTDLTGLSAIEMASGVRDRSIDPVELVDAHLRRVETTEPRLHAFVRVLDEEARHDARQLRERGDAATLPLAGVPVAVKDSVAVAGEPTTYGSLAAPRTPATRDDLLVERLRDAGAIVIGRTRLPELAIWPFTEFEQDDPTRNPWNPARTCGGSSGGSAVAVAARMSALALASDGGGSIRIPAACCGLVGVKPAPGIVPLAGGAASHWYGLSAYGSLARTVEDAALMLDVLAGTDSYRHPRPPEHTLRIAVSARHPVLGARASREVRRVLETTATLLSDHGHHVIAADPPYPALPLEFLSRYLAGIATDAEGLDDGRLERRTREMARRGRRLRARARPASESRYAEQARRWMAGFDLLVAPILSGPPPRVGRWRGRGWISTALGVSRWVGFAPPWNLAGMAAVAVPAAVVDGLPVGLQLVGLPGSEARLLSVALQLQTAPPGEPGRSVREVQAGR